MREELIAAITAKKELIERLRSLKKAYIREHSSYIYISDHAIVRYIERVKGDSLYPFKGDNDAQTIDNYLKYMNMYGGTLRNEILSENEQKRIVNEEMQVYKKDGFAYIIKNLSLVTIIPINSVDTVES